MPKGTPDAVVRRISAALNASLAKPQIHQVLENEGMFAMRMAPEEYTRLMQSDFDRWGQLTRSLKLRAE